jgi:hypothetical protein
LAIDSSGNIHLMGEFQGTVDFNPGSGSFLLSAGSGQDVFVSKLNALGQFVWARRFRNNSTSQSGDIAVDAAGNLYTTGSFYGRSDFDPLVGEFFLRSGTQQSVFVSKLDSSGNFSWAKKISPTHDGFGFGIVLDSSANVYVTGPFRGNADFNPGTASFTMSGRGGAVFDSKLTTTGQFTWAVKMGGIGEDAGRSIAVHGTAVHTTGTFEATADFDPGAGVYNLDAGPGRAIFVSKLSQP